MSRRPSLIGIERIGSRWLGYDRVSGDQNSAGSRISPQARQTAARKRRAGALPGELDDRRRQVPEAHRLADNPSSPQVGGRHDQKGYADLGPVQALTVIEEVVFPQSLTMIGRDDHQRLIQHA